MLKLVIMEQESTDKSNAKRRSLDTAEPAGTRGVRFQVVHVHTHRFVLLLAFKATAESYSEYFRSPIHLPLLPINFVYFVLSQDTIPQSRVAKNP